MVKSVYDQWLKASFLGLHMGKLEAKIQYKHKLNLLAVGYMCLSRLYMFNMEIVGGFLMGYTFPLSI